MEIKTKWNCETLSGFLYFRRILCLIYSSGRNFLELKGRIRNAASWLYLQFLPCGLGMVSCALRGLALLYGAWRCFLLFFPLNSVISPASLGHLLSLPCTCTARSLWRIHAQKSYVSPVMCRLAKILFFFSIPTEEELRSSNESPGQHHFY